MDINKIFKEDIENSFKNCDIPISSGVGEHTVIGTLPFGMLNNKIVFWAASPPNFGNSFSGSGLPFGTYQQAYENTPNHGAVKSVGNKFKFNLAFPNSYYEEAGSVYVKPHVNIMVCSALGNKFFKIELGEGIAYRSLGWPKENQNTRERNDCLFYSGREKMPVVSQEQLLRNSAYKPNQPMAENYWGGSVPQA